MNGAIIRPEHFRPEDIPKRQSEVCEICLGEIEFVFAGRLFGKDFFHAVTHKECEGIQTKRIFEDRRKRFEEEERIRKQESFSFSEEFFKVNSPLPKNYNEMTLENFTVHEPKNQQALNEIKMWKPDLPFGFLITGPTGTGKTHLLIAIINKLIEDSRGVRDFPKISFDNTSSIINGLLRDKSFTLSEYREAEYLFLDDIGSENSTEWSNQQLFEIINHRYNQKLPTFFSSNFDIADLRKRIGERNMSRILEIAYPITIIGKDNRISNLKNMKSMLYEKSGGDHGL